MPSSVILDLWGLRPFSLVWPQPDLLLFGVDPLFCASHHDFCHPVFWLAGLWTVLCLPKCVSYSDPRALP